MGLDMYIFKQNPELDEVKKKIDSLTKELSNDKRNFYVKYKKDIEKEVKKFVQEYRSIIRECYLDSIVEFFVNWVKEFGDVIADLDTVKWHLFNYYTRFSYDTPEGTKNKLTKSFMSIIDKFSCPVEIKNKSKEIDKLRSKADNLYEEVAYWRKYHDLNNYILDTFGGDNCEDTPLSKDDMYSIQKFIKNNGQDTKQIDEILEDWDETYTYVYHPWW